LRTKGGTRDRRLWLSLASAKWGSWTFGYLLQAADGDLKGILEYTTEPLVSSDFNHNPASSIVDSLLTKVSGGTLVKVASWYDNEWGFSNRMLDVTVALHGAT